MMPSAVIWVLIVAAICDGCMGQDRIREEFLETHENCFQQVRLPFGYRERFARFDYPDEALVHRYVSCLLRGLELWSDRNGLNVERIAAAYRDKANTEILVPILANCNRNTHNETPTKFSYTAFKCILSSRVGPWFKEDIRATFVNGTH